MINFRWPDDAKLAFAIRDDDVCYFTQPWMLDAVYNEAWKLGFKVSLSVIPCVKAAKLRLVPAHLRRNGKYYSVLENRELIDYLREKMAEGYIDVIQHGYSHEKGDGRPEFTNKDYLILKEKFKKGKEILEKAVKRDIRVFAAPHDRLSRTAMRILYESGVSLSRKFAVGRFLFTIPISRANLGKAWGLLLSNPNPLKPIRDSIIPLDRMLVIRWDNFLMGKNIDDEIEMAKRNFVRRLLEGGSFVIAQHYWEYFDSWNFDAIRKERLSKFNEFLHFVASKEGVWKTTLSEIVDWIMALRSLRSDFNCY
ncbi:MAG: DUF2334 domain-containing protein [Candidatus Bathyarchaeia archaeon]